MTIESKYKLLDVVYITALETKGVVTAISLTDSGISYRTRYFYSGKAEEVFFYDFEIQESAK